MFKVKSIGTAKAKPGSIQYGRIEILTHPTGHREFFPIIIAQGKEDGPCLWLTAGIHGPEQVGPTVLYKLINQELVQNLLGTIIAIPALSPAGLRTMQREPYHDSTDPNRLWPEVKRKTEADPDDDPPSSLEIAYKRLFDMIAENADCMIDYHAAWTGSLSFAFRDRIAYKQSSNDSKEIQEAEDLSTRQYDLLKAYGHTIILEMPMKRQIKEDLHRSSTGAVMLLAKIPAFTVELGTGHVPEPAIVNASIAGTRNVMRKLGMLDSEYEPIPGIKVIDLGFPVRRCSTPRVKKACVVLHCVQAGEIVKAGDPVAEIRDIWGRPIGNGYLYSEYDGFVIGRQHGIYFYPGAPVLAMAIPNNDPLIVPYPKDYLEKEN